MKTKIAALIILGFIPAITSGNFSEITNNVSVEANTGGNTAENGGTVTKGKAQASVEIKTEVNGEEIENVDIKIKSDGEVKEYTKEETKTFYPATSSSRAEDGKTKVETKIELQVDGETETIPEESEQSSEESIDNLMAVIIKTVFESIKSLFSWFI